MSTTKRILGDYNINTIDSDGDTANDVTVTTEVFRVKGDLVVTGDSSVVSETNLNISNNTILLNEGETGAGVTAGSSGTIIDRGTETNARLLFDESDDTWKIDPGNGTLTAIATSSGGGIGLEDIVEDTTPQLGGNLDVNSQQIVSVSNGDIVLAPNGTGTVKVESAELAFDRLTADPTAQADYNLLYHKTEGSGGTGLYFKTSSTADELVSKSKAIVYGIIF